MPLDEAAHCASNHWSHEIDFGQSEAVIQKIVTALKSVGVATPHKSLVCHNFRGKYFALCVFLFLSEFYRWNVLASSFNRRLRGKLSQGKPKRRVMCLGFHKYGYQMKACDVCYTKLKVLSKSVQ
ncbi:hypothetical protein WA026_021784 [Henosepilachna vigintioctopunctata]|uniref:Uncharacterized protein n=1 Tax=Henosepilachna vigintioctopunctata TaxID=420089 RepID=A0AAW1TSH4_9CUCU